MSQSRVFRTNIDVTVGDLNYGGHVGNDRFLLFFHEARIRFLREVGLSEMDIGEGVGLIMSEAQVKYRAQVKMGDVLEVEVSIVDMRRVRFAMEYKISKKLSGEITAEGRTVMGGFDYTKNRVVPLPVSFTERFVSE